MNSNELRKLFLEFFEKKGHQIVPSASIVLKDDPTLMFTNAGMNQFKDVFLGSSQSQHKRIVNAQKCLRISGKHNDLAEVGKDTYHHTMFEMLGNWSFNDYNRKEAIAWAWEFLTEVFKLNRDDLYVTILADVDSRDLIDEDDETYTIWNNIVPQEHIIFSSTKDNFWEMGTSGPCGPCTEIHIDLRTKEEKLQTSAKFLINTGHPQVIELWNLVFIEYERLENGELTWLKNKFVDTGMGFERLCMIMQGKTSNYDTDLFRPLIKKLEEIVLLKYGVYAERDVAFRVIVDHIRTAAFAIADGCLPSNKGAGYVIRKVIRRAVAYGTSLYKKEAFIYKLIPTLIDIMGDQYPELKECNGLIIDTICKEEWSFLKTLSKGYELFNKYKAEHPNDIIVGKFAFKLYDTYGFPLDLTIEIATENKMSVDVAGFEKCLQEQKERSRNDAKF